MKDKIFSMTIELQGNIHNTKTKDNDKNLTCNISRQRGKAHYYFEPELRSMLIYKEKPEVMVNL